MLVKRFLHGIKLLEIEGRAAGPASLHAISGIVAPRGRGIKLEAAIAHLRS